MEETLEFLHVTPEKEHGVEVSTQFGSSSWLGRDFLKNRSCSESLKRPLGEEAANANCGRNE